MTGTRVAILQSNYIPWKGYFDLMNSVDEFILYDCVQYTRSDWRNRNRIRCGDGCCFLTIPVSVPDRFETPIDAVEACDDHWRRKHFQALVCNYGRTPGFRLWGELFRELYLGGRERNLSRINRSFLEAVNRLLGIRTVLHDAREFALPAGWSGPGGWSNSAAGWGPPPTSPGPRQSAISTRRPSGRPGSKSSG